MLIYNLMAATHLKKVRMGSTKGEEQRANIILNKG